MNKLSYFAMAAICGFAFASCSGDDDCDSAAPMGYYENFAYNSPMEALADDSGA